MKKFVAAAVLAMGLVPAAPAFAHTVSVTQGVDQAWVDNLHDRIFVSDNECDGHSVYAQFRHRYDGETFFKSFSDADGCGEGVSIRDPQGTILEFRLCEQRADNTLGCTAWKDA